MSGLDSIFRAPFHYWRSFWRFNISDVFGGGSKVSRKLDLHFLHDLTLSFYPGLLDFSSLVSGSSRSFDRVVLSEVSWGFYLLFTCVQEAQKVLEVLICAYKKCSGNYFPSLLVSYFCDEEGLPGLYFLISDGPFSFTSFLVM